MLDNLTDTEVIAKTAWGENRGGGILGMQSVINVIQNRTKHPSWWGHTIREVCLKPMQFDCWNENDPNREKLLDVNAQDDDYVHALTLASEAISGTLQDLTHGSTYYFAKSMHEWPEWARGKEPVADIAGQLFFNNVE